MSNAIYLTFACICQYIKFFVTKCATLIEIHGWSGKISCTYNDTCFSVRIEICREMGRENGWHRHNFHMCEFKSHLKLAINIVHINSQILEHAHQKSCDFHIGWASTLTWKFQQVYRNRTFCILNVRIVKFWNCGGTVRC